MCVNSIPGWTKVGVPTIGQCKGTLDAVKAADLIIIFHVPLFTKWLKEVMDGGTRVLMIIDAPDDLDQLMSPKGLKEAMKYAEGIYKRTKTVRVTNEAGTDFTYQCGEYPVMTQWGYADEPGHFDHWGAGHIHTFPNEGSATGKVVIAAGRHRDPAVLPLCGRSGLARNPRRPCREDRGRPRRQADARLAGGRQDRATTDRDPYAVSHLGWGMNPQAHWYGIGLNGDEPERSRAAARVFPGNFLFSTGPEHAGRRQAQHPRPLRRADARLHRHARQSGDHRQGQAGRSEDGGRTRSARLIRLEPDGEHLMAQV